MIKALIKKYFYANYYILTVEQSTPYTTIFYPVQFPSHIEEKTARRIVENWRKSNLKGSMFSGSSVLPEVKKSRKDLSGTTLKCDPYNKMGRYSRKQVSKPIIAYKEKNEN